MKAVTVLAACLLADTPVCAGGCDGGTPRVAIDIGHSHAQPGAISARGRSEFSFNLELARHIRDLLAGQGVSAHLLNEDGTLKLQERPGLARQVGADLLLSLHHDSVQPRYLASWTVNGHEQKFSDRYRGHSLFVSAANAEYQASRRMAEELGRQLRRQGLTPTLHHAEAIEGENRPLLDAALGLYRFDGLYVLRSASMPAVLLEAGVIVHRDEELALLSRERRDRIAQAVADAIRGHCSAAGAH